MKAQEIFESSVKAMKQLLTRDEMMDSIKRAKERGEEGNLSLLVKERENVNELVRRVVDAGGSRDALKAERAGSHRRHGAALSQKQGGVYEDISRRDRGHRP